jgi:transcriptional regulator with XRE-family HTH domain
MIRMSFGSKFKVLRESKGLPRAGIDELFNLMPGTVSNWENGFREPEEDLLPELASFFGVRIKDLMDDAA